MIKYNPILMCLFCILGSLTLSKTYAENHPHLELIAQCIDTGKPFHLGMSIDQVEAYLGKPKIKDQLTDTSYLIYGDAIPEKIFCFKANELYSVTLYFEDTYADVMALFGEPSYPTLLGNDYYYCYEKKGSHLYFQQRNKRIISCYYSTEPLTLSQKNDSGLRNARHWFNMENNPIFKENSSWCNVQ